MENGGTGASLMDGPPYGTSSLAASQVSLSSISRDLNCDAHLMLSVSSPSDPSLTTPHIVPLPVPLCSLALSLPIPSSLRQPPGDPAIQSLARAAALPSKLQRPAAGRMESCVQEGSRGRPTEPSQVADDA